MKKSILVVMLLACLNIASFAADDMIILDAEGNGKKYMRINGIVEDCEVTLSSDGTITKTDCLILTNSKKIKILCTKKKSMCKTYNEIHDALNNVPSSKTDVSGLKALRQNMKYSEAREIILNAGWQGIRKRWQDVAEYGQQVRDIYYTNGWQEVDDCAGTGLAPCRFVFQDINQKTLVVGTEGECLNSKHEYPKEGEKCDLSVSHWSLE